MSAETDLTAFVQRLGATGAQGDVFAFTWTIPFHGKVLRGSKNALAGVEINASMGAPLVGNDVLFRKENGLDRFGKNVHLNRELSLGEPAFDNAIYVEADVPDEVVRGLLEDALLRAHLLSIVGSGAVESVVVTADGNLRFIVRPAKFAAVEEIKELIALAPSMIDRLVRGAPDRSAYRGDEVRARVPDLRKAPARSGWIGVLVVACILGSVASLVLMNHVTEVTLDVSSEEVGIVAAAFAMYEILLVRLFGGRYDGLRNVCVFTVFGLLPVIAGAGTAASLLNSSYDTSASTRMDAEIVTVSNKNGTHLEAILGGKQVNLRRSDFSPVGTRRKAAFMVKQGALGARWIVGSEVKP